MASDEKAEIQLSTDFGVSMQGNVLIFGGDGVSTQKTQLSVLYGIGSLQFKNPLDHFFRFDSCQV